MGIIREVGEDEYADAMEMVWKIFLRYNAPGYSMEGVQNFRKFLTDKDLYNMFRMGAYRVFGLFIDDSIEGAITLRNGNHISLLFVDGKYQKRGAGTALLNYLCEYCVEYEGQDFVTVNSSPYAVDFYRGYGFEDTGHTQESDGITYTPMKLFL